MKAKQKKCGVVPDRQVQLLRPPGKGRKLVQFVRRYLLEHPFPLLEKHGGPSGRMLKVLSEGLDAVFRHISVTSEIGTKKVWVKRFSVQSSVILHQRSC